jgi:hypothetical protein
MLNINYTESSSSKSSSDDEPDDQEQIYKQQKAKELLNQVFNVLGIPPVSDLYVFFEFSSLSSTILFIDVTPVFSNIR